MNAPADQTQDSLKLSSLDNVTLSEGMGGTIRTRTRSVRRPERDGMTRRPRRSGY
jgi:hypothetical protein